MHGIFEYPEFLLAGVLVLVSFVLMPRLERAPEGAAPRIRGNGFGLPGALSQPAIALISLLPASYLIWLQRMQLWAGWRNNSAFATLCAVKVATSFVALLSSFVIPPLFSFGLTFVLFFIPDIFVLAAVQKRQQQIKEALPQALDLMVLCVDAGLGLDATLKRISSEQSLVNPALNEELANLGRDLLLGMERERAYSELFNRTGVEELKILGSALSQCAKLGISIGKVLRTQSEFLRTRLAQKSEEKALKLPVWMSFPLWFCIMPALMLILIGPSIITFFKNVSHFPASWF